MLNKTTKDRILADQTPNSPDLPIPIDMMVPTNAIGFSMLLNGEARGISFISTDHIGNRASASRTEDLFNTIEPFGRSHLTCIQKLMTQDRSHLRCIGELMRST